MTGYTGSQAFYRGHASPEGRPPTRLQPHRRPHRRAKGCLWDKGLGSLSQRLCTEKNVNIIQSTFHHLPPHPHPHHGRNGFLRAPRWGCQGQNRNPVSCVSGLSPAQPWRVPAAGGTPAPGSSLTTSHEAGLRACGSAASLPRLEEHYMASVMHSFDS